MIIKNNNFSPLHIKKMSRVFVAEEVAGTVIDHEKFTLSLT